jgi:cellulose synthase/poly-beta-1,6-N-acetylglucosamine synthase-like glycosyltransferase
MWNEVIAGASLALAAPGCLYLTLLSLAALRRSRGAVTPKGLAPRVAIVVPAHNEGSGLCRTLDSLKRELIGAPHAQLLVIADNCSDDTATVARTAGVRVLERRDAQHHGKGHALAYAFAHTTEVDWYIVVDADTDVAPGFLHAMCAAMRDDCAALQCRYRVRDALASRRATLADVALAAWNVLRPRGRAALGLSAGILGNGFALARRTVVCVPYAAHSIVEDVEYHQLLLQAGLKVDWVDGTEVRGEMPEGAAAARQRARWEGGRLRLMATRAPRLAAGLLRGRWRLADPLLDLLTLPLTWLSGLLLLALMLGATGQAAWAGAGLLLLAAHVTLALRLAGAQPAHWRALLGVPAYLVWKLGLAGATFTAARRNHWVRSTRRPQ